MRLTVCLLLCYFFFPTSDSLFAQHSPRKAKELQGLLLSFAEDSLKVDSLTEFAYEIRYTDPANALIFAESAIKLADSLQYLPGLIDAYNRKAFLHQITGKYSSAISHYSKGLKIAESLDDLYGVARAYHQIATIHRHLSQFDEALDFESRALELFNELGKDGEASMVLGGRSAIFQLMEEYELALADLQMALKKLEGGEYLAQKARLHSGRGFLYEIIGIEHSAIKEHKQSLLLYEKISNLDGIATAHIGIGNNFFRLDQLDSALWHYQSILEKEIPIARKEVAGDLYHNLGRIYQTKNASDSAHKYLERSLAVRKELGQPLKLAQSYLQAGILNYQLENYEGAESYLAQSLEIADTIPDLSIQSKATQTLMYVYGKQNEADNILSIYKRSVDIQDSIQQLQSRAADAADMAVQYQQNLAELNEIKFSQSEQQRKILLWSASTVGLVLLLIIAVVIILLLRSRQRAALAEKNEEVAKANLEVEKVNASLKGQEEERNRIAKELHDQVGGILGLVRKSLKELSKDYTQAQERRISRIKTTDKLLNKAIESVRDISHKLGNRMLKNLGLIPALESFINDVEENTELDTSFSYDGLSLQQRFGADWESNVYQIIFEICNNAIAHANADLLSIHMIQEGQQLEIMIQDDGIGFDADSPDNQQGMGLSNIESRVNTLKGILQRESDGEGRFIRFGYQLYLHKRNSYDSHFDCRGPYIVRRGLVALFTPQDKIKVVATAKNGKETLELLKKHPEIKVVVLDIEMEPINGIEATRLIKKDFAHVGVLILSMYKKIQYIESSQEAEADGYLLKDSDKDELVHAIHEIANGEIYFGQEIMAIEKKHKRKKYKEIKLTKREIEVLKHIAKELTSQEIANALGISVHTVETHKKHLKSKLNVKGNVGLAMYAVENGFMAQQ